MAKIMFKDAINQAIVQEMEKDETVILLGLDVAGAAGTEQERDAWGGVLGVTKGIYPKFPERVIDTPISESAYIGAAVGASACGMRAIGELMFSDFMGVCFDQLYNQAAKFRYMFGGKAVTPVTIRTMIGAGFSAAAQHSQSPYSMFAHVPGMKCIIPSNPYDAKGLLAACIEDDDPCVFFEHKALYTMKGEVPEELYTIPLGKANVIQEGKDATIVAIGRMVGFAEKAAKKLAKDGIECTIIDPRTISPMDWDAVFSSVEKTGRLVVVDESQDRCGMASDIVGQVSQNVFGALKSAPQMVTPPFVPVPFAANLEAAYIPDAAKIEAAVRKTM
ncbi:MAG: alpha-ketoacid dehydrogenase subunit beta [Syntrophotaleaceae bacterium]